MEVYGVLTSVSGRHNLLALFEDQSRCHGSCEAVRQGAKCLTYDELNRSANTVDRREAVEQWIDLLLTRQYPPGRETSDAIFALSQLARYSSDRARDLPDSLRDQVLARLEQLGADETVLRPVREYHELEAAQESIALGDALPIGLRLREEDQQPAPVLRTSS